MDCAEFEASLEKLVTVSAKKYQQAATNSMTEQNLLCMCTTEEKGVMGTTIINSVIARESSRGRE